MVFNVVSFHHRGWQQVEVPRCGGVEQLDVKGVRGLLKGEAASCVRGARQGLIYDLLAGHRRRDATKRRTQVNGVRTRPLFRVGGRVAALASLMPALSPCLVRRSSSIASSTRRTRLPSGSSSGES
jgi:hypothetical protein